MDLEKKKGRSLELKPVTESEGLEGLTPSMLLKQMDLENKKSQSLRIKTSNRE